MADPASTPPEPPPERDFVAEYRQREREQRERGQWHRISGAGVEFAAAVGLLAFAGYGVDRWLDTAPWGLIVGVLVGFGFGMFLLIRVSKDAFR